MGQLIESDGGLRRRGRPCAFQKEKPERILANFKVLRILGSTMVVHMRHTKSHTANRRSHHALKVARFISCPKCNAKHLMHRVCPNCGNYRGRVVVDTMKKTLKKAKKLEDRKAVNSNKPETAPKAEKKEEKKEKSAEKETKKKK